LNQVLQHYVTHLPDRRVGRNAKNFRRSQCLVQFNTIDDANDKATAETRANARRLRTVIVKVIASSEVSEGRCRECDEHGAKEKRRTLG